ncbi:MAG: hypothetical protein M1546_05380 [Chloroflexi bacterium]|nr:hypothetical protein [Chloroflexota bacterium]
MRLKNLLPTLAFTSLMAVIGVVFMLAVTSASNSAAAQTSQEPPIPGDLAPSAALTFTGGPVIKLRPDPILAVGGVATINVQVTSTANVTLTYLRTDYEPSKPSGIGDSDCDKLDADAQAVFGPSREMGPGTSVSYTCVVTGVAATMPFTLRVRSANPDNPDPLIPYLGDADATLIVVTTTAPGILIVKGPEEQTVLGSSSVTFTISVSNTGNAALTGITVSDAQAPNCNRPSFNLGVGQGISYSCVMTNVKGSITNSAIASVTLPSSQVISSTSTATALVLPNQLFLPAAMRRP